MCSTRLLPVAKLSRVHPPANPSARRFLSRPANDQRLSCAPAALREKAGVWARQLEPLVRHVQISAADTVAYKQGSRIADTSVTDVRCRPSDQCCGVPLTLVAEGADRPFDSLYGSQGDRDFVRTTDGPCPSVNHQSATLSGCPASQFGEHLRIFADDSVKYLCLGL